VGFRGLGGFCAVTADEGGATRLVKLEDLVGAGDEKEKLLDEGWEEGQGEVEGEAEGREDCRERADGETGGPSQSRNAELRACLDRQSCSRAADQKWYWWW
jgi:hypothetical protein